MHKRRQFSATMHFASVVDYGTYGVAVLSQGDAFCYQDNYGKRRLKKQKARKISLPFVYIVIIL